MLYFLLSLLFASGVYTYLRERAFTQERSDWTRERAELLDRIQAPELVPQQRLTLDDGLHHVPFDDDAAFWAAREEMTAS